MRPNKPHYLPNMKMFLVSIAHNDFARIVWYKCTMCTTKDIGLRSFPTTLTFLSFSFCTLAKLTLLDVSFFYSDWFLFVLSSILYCHCHTNMTLHVKRRWQLGFAYVSPHNDVFQVRDVQQFAITSHFKRQDSFLEFCCQRPKYSENGTL